MSNPDPPEEWCGHISGWRKIRPESGGGFWGERERVKISWNICLAHKLHFLLVWHWGCCFLWRKLNKNIKIISVLVGVFYSFDLIFPMFPWCFLRFSNDLFCVSFNFLLIFSVFTYFSKMFSTCTYRSASCVAAYLMLKHDWDALRALKHIRQFRQIEVSWYSIRLCKTS